MSRSARASSATRYLAARTRLGIKFGLETITAIVEALGHPERRYPTLLVAGTNGKGSVVAYTDAVLRASGLRGGRYTSPHLVRVNERIAVDDHDIADDDLDRAVGRVADAASRLIAQKKTGSHPTFFETLTAAAFEHFSTAGIDVAVLEVGMGGRLDATNVAEPLASAIVTVDRDHERFLGSRLGHIAVEKAGVLRRGRVTVLGPMAKAARGAIETVAKRKGARLLDAREGTTVRNTSSGFDVRTPYGEYRAIRTLPGEHQIDNALVALRLLEEAQIAGLRVDTGSITDGFANTRWPGRLEWVGGTPPLLLDGAHNPAGARALAAYLHAVRPFVLVFGAMRDKRVPEMARALFPLANAVILTRAPSEGAAAPSTIKRRAGRIAQAALLEPNTRRALARAERLAREAGGAVVVAGSLYLVGAVKRLLANRAPA